MIFLKSVLSASAIATFIATASFAQGGNPMPDERLDSNGMPTTRSTPAEQATTAKLNDQVGTKNAAVDAKSAASNAEYQAQQQRYRAQLDQHRAQQKDYQDRTLAYNGLRERYSAERAAYRRSVWPNLYTKWLIGEHDANLVGERVHLISGRPLGIVINTAHRGDGDISALLVKLNDNKLVWIDAGDIRYNRADGIVMTNLNRVDLQHMSDERD